MNLKNANILIVDDDSAILTTLQLLLKQEVSKVVIEKNPNQLLSLLSQYYFDAVILDMNFSTGINNGNEGLYWMKRIQEVNAKISILLITAYADIDLAIRALKEGASDFIIKPWKNEHLITTLKDSLQKKESSSTSKFAAEIEIPKLIGNSESMQTILTKISKIAPTDANVLILGENGTGKDLVANAIHQSSLRAQQAFIKVDVGALTESIFESELFGYKKGAFTDAREDRLGRFETANNGTLFLDEIGNISLQQQSKLLTVLQNREVTPLGSNSAAPVNVRLICATNIGLNGLRDEQKFRKDLIYRINTIELIIPPLRERKEDIASLANYFLKFYSDKYFKLNLELSKNALDKLQSYSFPGNVRELQYCLERAVILSENRILEAEDFTFSPLEKSSVTAANEVSNLNMVEKQTILRVIEKNKGNISKAAKELGITRTALYRRLGKHDI